MKPVVHILASCRNPELLSATTLVFRTLRVGFPTAEVFVTGNNLDDHAAGEVMKACAARGAVFKNDFKGTIHYEWIRDLIADEQQLFWLCDSDVVFHASIEEKLLDKMPFPLGGRFIPKFRCPFTGAITHRRLHTSLMCIDPILFRKCKERDLLKLNEKNPFGTWPDFITPLIYPLDGEMYHHDTLSQAYHSFGGIQFSEADMLNRYDHINCGTYLDLLEEKIPGSRARQERYLNFPEEARGLWREQQKYYESRAA